MDPQRFDALVQTLGMAASRRRALAALLTGLVAPLLPDLGEAKRGKGKRRGKRRDNGKGGKRRAGAENHQDRDGGGGSGPHNRGKGQDKRNDKKGKQQNKPNAPSEQPAPAPDTVAVGAPACREAGHPCEGNQKCCENLICVTSGPGQAERCTPCPDGQIACANQCIAACVASDQCHLAGVCDPATGACSNPEAPNGHACSDNDSCTSGDSCQNGTCTPGAGVDCSSAGDECNRGVCRQSDGKCITERKNDGDACNDGDPCTRGDTCQGGTCVGGPPRSCPTCRACSGGDCQPVASDDRCATVCCGGVCCSTAGSCGAGDSCPSPCVATNAVCNPGSDECCDGEADCSSAASCARLGEARCCRSENADCSRDCDCCDGVCASDGVCCNPNNRQCRSTADCCEGQVCDMTNQVCTAVCGRQHAICGEFPCCPGFKCVRGECWPETCQAPTQQCTSSTQCCPDGDMDCRGVCCRPYNETCANTAECCDITVCGPQGKCCLGSFFDPERGGPGVRGCIGREEECCPGRRCNVFSNTCCREEGQPVTEEDAIDCCHFTRENGVCSCQTDGEACVAPLPGLPGVTSCCDGLICFAGKCNPATCVFPAGRCGAGDRCCGELTCQRGFCQ
jgi:hypothetical protein